ncbi:MAG: hypothetical protein ACTSWY_15740 [Promethearchaeota archaeon]
MPAKILNLISNRIVKSNTIICIGFGDNLKHNKKINTICREFSLKHKLIVITIGDIQLGNLNSSEGRDKNSNTIIIQKKDINLKEVITRLTPVMQKLRKTGGIIQISVNFPEKCLLDLVFSQKGFTGIRGSFSSATFLKALTDKIESFHNNKIVFSRIALMETINGEQFFYGPVGIDEANSLDKKKQFIINAEKMLKLLDLDPKISVLSGGRAGDMGRDNKVDKTIIEAQSLESFFQNEYNGKLNIFHDQILIEKAVKRNPLFIIAPDGISGNLIYRTLVHLGGGKAYGALYSSIFFKYKIVLIDCSRIAKKPEILGSLILASGFNNLLKE